MLFIKNLTKLSGDKIKLTMTMGDEISVALKIADTEPVTLAKSRVQGILTNLRKSFEYIGTTTKHLEKDENSLSTEIMSNKVTELGFFTKEIKTVFTEVVNFPVIIGEYDKDIAGDKHFPRDMILFIVPNDGEHFELVVDERNLGAKTITQDIGEYRLIGVFTKWPIWAKLKFPAYMYIKNHETEAVVAAFKLGFKTDKKLTKNCIIDVDINEAVDYLDESFRIMKEKKSKQGNVVTHDTYGKANNNQQKQGFGKKFNKDQTSNKNRTGVPAKYKNGNSTKPGNGNKKQHR